MFRLLLKGIDEGFQQVFPTQRGLKYKEHNPLGRHYLNATHTAVSSAIHTLTQVKAHFSTMAVIMYS
jgi:hypothetical protein